MKKYLMILFVGVAMLGLNGCGGGGSATVVVETTPSNATTLFLVDDLGFAYANIPYRCDSMVEWGRTAVNGEFTFFQPESCEFDFLTLRGDYNVNPDVDDIVRIVDYTDAGKGGIPYECELFGASTTLGDGSFYYDQDDRCVFHL